MSETQDKPLNGSGIDPDAAKLVLNHGHPGFGNYLHARLIASDMLMRRQLAAIGMLASPYALSAEARATAEKGFAQIDDLLTETSFLVDELARGIADSADEANAQARRVEAAFQQLPDSLLAHPGVKAVYAEVFGRLPKRPAPADANEAFEAGWRTAAIWASRSDLVSDIGSAAYVRDRDAALGRNHG